MACEGSQTQGTGQKGHCSAVHPPLKEHSPKQQGPCSFHCARSCQASWEVLSLSWHLSLRKEMRGEIVGRQPALSAAVKEGIIMETFCLHQRPDLTRKCQVPGTLAALRETYLFHCTKVDGALTKCLAVGCHREQDRVSISQCLMGTLRRQLRLEARNGADGGG